MGSLFDVTGADVRCPRTAEDGLKVAALEDDQALQEAVLSLFHATVATFQMTACVKVVENSQGKGTFLIVNQPRG